MKRKNNLIKVAFALNGFLFLMGGIELVGKDKYVFAMIQLLASILNISMILKIRSKRTMEKLNYSILVMNVIVCLSIAVDNILSNKLYIQYVWLIAATVSLVALIIQIKRNKSSTEHP